MASRTTLREPHDAVLNPLRRPAQWAANLARRAAPKDRPVLHPVHPNLRRLPSRTMAKEDDVLVRAGSKRKRSTSRNENATRLNGGLHAPRYKRQRSLQSSQSDDEDEDTSDQGAESMQVHVEEPTPDDHFLLSEAPHKQLLRQTKTKLSHLLEIAGLQEDTDEMTKSMLVDRILEVRDDEDGAVPPSSPPGTSSGGSDTNEDDLSADEFGRGHPSERTPMPVRRRATEQVITPVRRFPNTKTFSFNNGLRSVKNKFTARFAPNVPSPVHRTGLTLRRTPSRTRSLLSSPPGSLSSTNSTSSRVLRSRPGKTRQSNSPPNPDVAFPTHYPSTSKSPSAYPSPRRLRSSGSLRVTPARRAKCLVGSLKEPDTTDDDLEEDEDEEGTATDSDEQDADEEDELMSDGESPSGHQTPARPRIRSASIGARMQPDSQESSEPRRLRNGKVVGDTAIDDDDDDDADTITSQDEDDDESVTESESSSTSETPEDDSVEKSAEEDEDQDEDEEMTDDDDSVLTNATAKSLVRLRKDDLVRLCESRALDVEGTKPQLVEALLQWRDTKSSAPSSDSTARPPSTSRPGRPGRLRNRSGTQTPPVLLRSDRVHVSQPRTPMVSEGRPPAPGEPELEFDLESLGLEDREIPPDKITKSDKIGSGGFKDVFIGKLKGRRVAIAEFRGQLSAMDIKELKLLSDFDHPNVVKFIGLSIPEETKLTPVMIISELCTNGDLFDYIRNTPAPSLNKVLLIMHDIAKGLQYLHLRKPSVIHRDCKSSNILITSKVTAKITDFGLAKVKQSTRSMVRSLVGTVNWQAPELWSPHPQYDHKVDVFSLACVFWEILQWHLPEKKFPWEGMNEHAIYEAVGQKRHRPPVTSLKKQWCPEIVNLMERMWAQEPQNRPTMTEVVDELHAFIHG